MDSFVFAAVLLAAACHAGWNATIKGGLDPLATTVLISIGAAIVAAVFLPLVGLPARAAWPLALMGRGFGGRPNCTPRAFARARPSPGRAFFFRVQKPLNLI
jgi:hypothetical protein